MSGAIKYDKKRVVFVGKKNVGKSSLINALSGHELCLVSDSAGTTTSQVNNQMDLFSYGPIVLIDTAGIDYAENPKEKSLNNTIKAITNADFAVILLDARDRLLPEELKLLKFIRKISLPFILVINKIEYGVNPLLLTEIKWLNTIHFEISCAENVGIENLKKKLIRMLPRENTPKIIGDILNQGDVVVLVTPSDQSAAKNKLILSQIHAVKEALEEDSIVVIVKDKNLRSVLYALKNPPDLIVSDNESFERITADVPESIKITTYSILTARFKGEIRTFIKGLQAFDNLNDGDQVLIAEACPHHPNTDDTGRVRVQRWLRLKTKKKILFKYSKGGELPENISDYRLIIHCEGCMLSRRALQARIKQAEIMDIPIINYGIFNSFVNGALPRALEPLNITSEN